MASSDSRRSSVSTADSGISGSTAVSSRAEINPRYACHWLPVCRGEHEADQCGAREAGLRGKLGIYYSSDGTYKTFDRDELSTVSLMFNPTGCTRVYLLIYTKTEAEVSILFVGAMKKEKKRPQEGKQQLLVLPTSGPCCQSERPAITAKRALESISGDRDMIRDITSRLRSFLFVDAAAIYPVCMSRDEASRLTDGFAVNEEAKSVHWFTLAHVLSRLPTEVNYLKSQATATELAQVHKEHYYDVALQAGNQSYRMWSPTVFHMTCIQNHVGLAAFVQP